jgi:hypothetical protein
MRNAPPTAPTFLAKLLLIQAPIPMLHMVVVTKTKVISISSDSAPLLKKIPRFLGSSSGCPLFHKLVGRFSNFF